MTQLYSFKIVQNYASIVPEWQVGLFGFPYNFDPDLTYNK